MTVRPDNAKLEELVTKIRRSLERELWFEAERLGNKALIIALKTGAFAQACTVVELLHESRQQRFSVALSHEVIHVLTETVTEEMSILPGCWLIEPPFVGADARRLSMAALHREIPVAALAREPMTRLGMWPVVAICPGTTIRTKLDPPADPARPDLEWFVRAVDELGDWGIQSIDMSMPVSRRIDAILARLDALPLHTGLHQLLIEQFEEAHRDGAPARAV